MDPVGPLRFGLPVGLATLVPLAMLGGLYVRRSRTSDLGVRLGAFAAVWTAFEAWRWLNAASDPAVWIPDWTPFPLAAAVALVIAAVAIVIGAQCREADLAELNNAG